jgi:hypothetical protein
MDTNILFKMLIEKNININGTTSTYKESPNLELRYFIISDTMILIFSPYLNTNSNTSDKSNKNSNKNIDNNIKYKNHGKLIFYSNLAHIEKFITSEIDSSTEELLKKEREKDILNKEKDKFYLRFKIKWKESDIYLGNSSSYDNYIIMEFDKFLEFEQKINEKRKILFDEAELFSEDYMKYFPSENLNKVDETKIIELVIYHENNFMKIKNETDFDSLEIQSILKEQAKEIVFLYKKIVEIFSLNNDQNYSIYMNKMQNFLEIAKNFLEDVKESNFMLFDSSFT